MTSHRHRRHRRGPRRPGREPAADAGRLRPRRARPGPGRRALAQRALGLPAPAHAELDDPAPRLVVPRSRPGRLHERGRRSSGYLERYAESFDAPVLTGTTVQEVSARRRRLPASSRTGAPGVPGSVVVATGPHGKPVRAAGAARRPRCSTANRYRNPGQLARRGRPRGRRLGVRRPDRRRAGPGRPRGRARGRPAHPDAAPLPRDWTSSGGWRPPAGWPARSTTCPTRSRRAARRRCSWSGATTRRPGDQDLDLGTLQARGVRLAGHVERGHRARRPVPRRPGRHRPGRRSDHAPVPRRGRPARPREPD